MKHQSLRGYILPAIIFEGILGRCQSCVAEDIPESKSDLLHFMAINEC